MGQRRGTAPWELYSWLKWREGGGIHGWASLFCPLAQRLPSQFITHQCVLSGRNRGCSQHQEVILIYCADFAWHYQRERGREKKNQNPFIEHICFQAVQKEELSSVLSVLIEKYFHTSASWLIFRAVMFPPATRWCGLCAAAGRCSFNPSRAPDNVKERLLVLRVLS